MGKRLIVLINIFLRSRIEKRGSVGIFFDQSIKVLIFLKLGSEEIFYNQSEVERDCRFS